MSEPIKVVCVVVVVVVCVVVFVVVVVTVVVIVVFIPQIYLSNLGKIKSGIAEISVVGGGVIFVSNPTFELS